MFNLFFVSVMIKFLSLCVPNLSRSNFVFVIRSGIVFVYFKMFVSMEIADVFEGFELFLCC